MAEKNPFEETPEQIVEGIAEGLGVRLSGFTIHAVDTSVDEAIEIVQSHLESGKPFTNAQLDVCTEVLATMLPASERGMLREISEQNNYPLWVGMLAQWRRMVEYSEQYAILIDPDWQEKIDSRVQEVNGAVVVVDEEKLNADMGVRSKALKIP